MVSYRQNRVLAAAVVLLCALAIHSGAQTITINRATEYQTMDGLGGFACIKTAKLRSGPFYVDAPWPPFWDTLCYDLGASLIRFEVAGSYQTTAGGAYNVNGDVFCGPTMMGNINQMREFAARGVNRFLYTVWSPPGYMKPVGITGCINEAAPDYNTTDCKLTTSYYDDFANFLVAYLQAVSDSIGVQPYALSLQNEPRFSQPFNSCVYNSDSYRNVHRTAVPIIRTDFPNVKFIGNEDLTGGSWDSWMSAFMNDAALKPYMHALALHYGGASGYASCWNLASQHGKRLWGSEESYYETLMSQAQAIHWALTTGNASGWILWTLESLFDGGADGNSRTPTGSYAACKHYFRFVRPDAKRIGVSGQGSLSVSAFKHDGDNTTTVVILNSGGAANVTITGSGLPSSFYVYRSVGTTLCQQIGTVALNTSISIPASSMTTLYSQDITSVQKPSPTPVSEPFVYRQSIPAGARTYTLNGKLAGASQNRAPACGIRVFVDGRNVSRGVITEAR